VDNPEEAYLTLHPSAVSGFFWTPDVFPDRAKALRTPALLTPAASLRVYADSRLRYSGRFNFDVACPMSFHNYPVDKQVCEIDFESFGHTNK